MAINYTWNVKRCDVFPTKSGKSNVVHNVHWRLTATDDANNDSDGNPITAEMYGSQDTVTAMKAGLDAQIAEKITPTSVQKTLG